MEVSLGNDEAKRFPDLKNKVKKQQNTLYTPLMHTGVFLSTPGLGNTEQEWQPWF